MSDNEYLSEEEEEEEEEEDEEEEGEDDEPRATTHTKGSKPLTPLTFGRTFTNQRGIKTDDNEDGGIEEEEEEKDDDDGLVEDDDDGLVEDEDDEEDEEDEEEQAKSTTTGKSTKGKRKRSKKQDEDEDDNNSDNDSEKDEADEMDDGEDGDEEEEEEGEGEAERYMHQFEKEITKEYILETHPECIPVNMAEVRAMLPVIRNEDGIIVDDFHKTLPLVTKYEKARIIGQRAMQLNSGATPYIPVENLIDGTTIAELEFEQKKIPVIIKRPLPNGAFEYWRLKDLDILY